LITTASLCAGMTTEASGLSSSSLTGSPAA
jgi:hypothetical protein